jgi:hypothetical protein
MAVAFRRVIITDPLSSAASRRVLPSDTGGQTSATA